jgi:hypothetical protein
MTCGVVALVLWGLCPGVAAAQSVSGHGKLDNGPNLSPSQISVDAWLDADGVAHGSMVWVGDISPGSLPMAGPADPWFIDVTDIVFDGNTAYVTGVVSHSVFPTDIGNVVSFAFTDNSGTGQPDEIDGQPIEAGNITVDD